MIHLIVSIITMFLTCFGLVRCREEQSVKHSSERTCARVEVAVRPNGIGEQKPIIKRT